MAIQPNRIQKQMVQTQEASDSGTKWGSILGALGAGAAIAATGGGAAAALGAAGGGMSLGGLLGGAVGNKKAEYKEQKLPAPVPTGRESGADGTAMARRLADKSQNELMALIQAENALAKAPPSIQQEYAEPIIAARKLAQQKYGVA